MGPAKHLAGSKGAGHTFVVRWLPLPVFFFAFACSDATDGFLLPDDDLTSVEAGILDQGGVDPGGFDSGTRAADVGDRDGGASQGWFSLSPSLVNVRPTRPNSSAEWSIQVTVRGEQPIDLARLALAVSVEPGWSLSASVDDPGRVVSPEEVFTVRGLARPNLSASLSGTLRIEHPLARPAQARFRGVAELDPAELEDPEDIGFGSVEGGRSATIVARFSETPRVVELPAGLTASVSQEGAWTRVDLTLTPPRMGRVSGALTVNGRRIPISGEGVASALRALPSAYRLGDLGLSACATASVGVGNRGLGEARLTPLELSTSGPVTADWSTPLSSSSLLPLEETLVAVRVCTTGRGPFAVHIRQAGTTVATLSGRARGGELAARGPLRLDTLVAGLSRVVTATLSNPGQGILQIAAITPSTPEITILEPRLPVELPAQQTLPVRLSVDPSVVGLYSEHLRVDSSDPMRPIVDVPVQAVVERASCDGIAIETPILDLGASADIVAQSSVVMHNRGTSPCSVLVPTEVHPDFEWLGPTFGAAWQEGVRRLSIGPSERVWLPYRWTRMPSPGPRQARLRLRFAPGRLPSTIHDATLSVAFESSGLSVAVTPTGTCLDDVATEGATFNVRLAVVGPDPVTLERVDVRSLDRFFRPTLPDLPTVLAAGDSTSLRFDVDAGAPGIQAVEVVVRYRYQGRSKTLRRVLVAGSPSPEHIDRFRQLGSPKIDVLFWVDGSASMSDIPTLGPNLDAFMQFAVAQRHGMRAAVAEASASGVLAAPPGLDPFIDVDTAERPAEALRARLEAARPVDGPQLEQPLDGIRRAVETWRASGRLRSEAVLSIIAISDEDDASPGSVDAALGELLSVKGFRNTNLFSMSVVAGQPWGACLPGATAGPAPRLTEMANRTGGVVSSVCIADWSRSLEDLSTTAFGFKSRSFLTQQPIVSTIRVFVEGVEVPARLRGAVYWSYDFATNSVNFSPIAVPERGAAFEVRYRVECL